MKITTEQKEKIRTAAIEYANRFSSRAQAAHALKINVAQFSTAIDGGKLSGVLADDKWIDIACQLNVSLDNSIEWKIAKTKVFIYLTEQFEICQCESISGIFCDVPDCGKTVAANHYAANNKNAIKVDCSIFKSKRRLIHEIARLLGIPQQENYWKLFDKLIWSLNHIERPLVILDEFGDCQYEAILEVKALWNATEGRCGWFLMGADALRAKLERGQAIEKVGFAELFSRFGSRYQGCIAQDIESRKNDLVTQAALVAKLNAPEGTDIMQLLTRNGCSMRRIYHEITKNNGRKG